MSILKRLLLAVAILLVDIVVFVLPLAAILVAYGLVVRPARLKTWIDNLYADRS